MSHLLCLYEKIIPLFNGLQSRLNKEKVVEYHAWTFFMQIEDIYDSILKMHILKDKKSFINLLTVVNYKIL